MQTSILILLFVLFIISVVTNWREPKDPNRYRLVVGLLLLPFCGWSQTMTFDYYINLTGSDSLYVESATIEIQPDYVEVRTPYEFFSRYIVATGADREGDKMYFFTGGGVLRICRNYRGELTGAFLRSRGNSRYFGVDSQIYDRLGGWTNKNN